MTASNPPPCKKRVLLVDDEESFTRLLKLNLERTGRYEVRVVNWGGAALAATQDFLPDIVLLDVIMPQVFGGDVASQISQDPKTRHIPVVFLSASVRKSRVEEHEGVINGFPFIAKPADLAEITAAIEKYTAPKAP
jgi:CheY-like chemotaxis protein